MNFFGKYFQRNLFSRKMIIFPIFGCNLQITWKLFVNICYREKSQNTFWEKVSNKTQGLGLWCLGLGCRLGVLRPACRGLGPSHVEPGHGGQGPMDLSMATEDPGTSAEVLGLVSVSRDLGLAASVLDLVSRTSAWDQGPCLGLEDLQLVTTVSLAGARVYRP